MFLVGLGVAWVEGRKHPEHRAVLLLVLTWLLVISGLYMLPGSVHYNNFRHVLFVLPALFVFFAFGLKLLLNAIRPIWLQVIVMTAMLASGVLGILRLHPYEYAYYNAYTGGTSGANSNYHLDYWCLLTARGAGVCQPGRSAWSGRVR